MGNSDGQGFRGDEDGEREGKVGDGVEGGGVWWGFEIAVIERWGEFDYCLYLNIIEENRICYRTTPSITAVNLGKIACLRSRQLNSLLDVLTSSLRIV